MNETRWVRGVAVAGATAVAAFGAVGLVLADAGEYRAALVYPIGFVAWMVLLRAVWSVVRAPAASDRSSHLAGAGAVVLAAGVGCWNALHASQHILTDRDPGIYNNTARWIARSGNLEFTARIGPFGRSPFVVSAPGVLPVNGRNDLVFQFAHLLPALLAEARGVGGDRFMFMLPAILGAVALFEFFVVASRLLHHPFGALAATACLAFVLPEIYFSRDSYSEIPMQVLFFTALWLLCDDSVLRRSGPALVAGFCLGLLQAVRIDALAVIVGVPVVVAAVWIRQAHRDRRLLLLPLCAFAGGIAAGVGIGVADLRLRSDPYLAALKNNVLDLIGLIALAVIAAAVGVLLAPAIGRASRRWVSEPRRRLAANGAAALTILVGFGAWLVRPALNPMPKVAEQTSALVAAGVALPTRPYTAHSVVWMAWYLGPLTVALAIAGAALVVRALVMHVRREWLVAVALLAPETVLYLWRPRAHPDQVWVTRRFLVCAFPAAILLAFGLMVAVASRAREVASGAGRVLGRVGVVVVGLATILYPMWTDVHVRATSEQHNFLSVVEDTCKVIGPDSALVIVNESTSLASVTVPVSIRTWCGVPSAGYHGRIDRVALERVASQWNAQGRRLWIGAESPSTIRAWFPGSHLTVTDQVVNHDQLSRPFTHRPSGYLTERLRLALAPVPTG